MTRLLVSVRNRSEALTALDAGADLIDVKEPARGALGRADAATIAEIAAAVDGRLPVSAAFGELAEWNETQAAPFTDALGRIQFAKVGLAQCGGLPDWRLRWTTFNERLPAGTASVAVVYADATAMAPSADEVIAQAIRAGCQAVLIDTFDKTTGSLVDQWTPRQIRDIIQQIRSQHMLAVLGGSLNEATLVTVLPLMPDVIAIRTAACISGSRTAPICAKRIRQLRSLLA